MIAGSVVQRSNIASRYLVVALFLALTVFLVALPAQAQTIPTISIASVVTDTSVTVTTHNFPPNQNFTVTMGPFGTQGINGIVVGTTNSGAGGSFSATYNIPDQLKGSYRIAIRMSTSHAYPFFAYNWFFNNTTGTTPPPTTPVPPPFTGTPTFSIQAVVRDTSVTIMTKDFPPNQTFNVTMGPMGTQGINGYNVGTLQSGAGGALTATYPIPQQLWGSYRIAIRAQTAGAYPFFAYNWFFNNTTP